MSSVIRATDIAIGICNHPKSPGHPITCVVSQGSPVTSADSLAIARSTDTTENTCIYSKTGVIISGSPLTNADNLGIARLGIDIVQFTYGVATFVSGSPITSTD